MDDYLVPEVKGKSDGLASAVCISQSDLSCCCFLGNELQELQKMIDSLQSPQDPSQVAQALLLRREVTLLQFDAAMRHLLR